MSLAIGSRIRGQSSYGRTTCDGAIGIIRAIAGYYRSTPYYYVRWENDSVERQHLGAKFAEWLLIPLSPEEVEHHADQQRRHEHAMKFL